MERVNKKWCGQLGLTDLVGVKFFQPSINVLSSVGWVFDFHNNH
jgi:hypothetical protein